MRLIQSGLDDDNPIAINVPIIAYAREPDAGSDVVFGPGIVTFVPDKDAGSMAAVR